MDARRHEPQRPRRPQARPAGDARPPAARAAVVALGLQAAAGNQATIRMLRAARGLQRQFIDTSGSGAHPALKSPLTEHPVSWAEARDVLTTRIPVEDLAKRFGGRLGGPKDRPPRSTTR